jgi:osmotically-inducible protein OsmY
VPTQAVSDEIIANAIVESFKQNSDIDEAKLDVIVEDGKVALKGRVLSAKTALEAYDCASRVIGVRDINNEIIWDY